MRITTVEYRRLRTFGNYENESVGATAVVEPGETTHEALASLKLWVEAELSVRQENSKASERHWQVRRELKDLERDLDEAKARWEKARAFLETHGLKIEDQDIPF